MNLMPKPEFPRPEKRREGWLNLNGTWNFQLFAAGNEDAEKAFVADRSGNPRLALRSRSRPVSTWR